MFGLSSFGFQSKGGGGGSGSVTSVGLSMPVAFSVSNSPITSSGTLVVTANGLSSQYIRGDGQLANFPTSTGGGSSVNYYLNGSISQGTFGGNTYYQMSNVANTGASVNFSLTDISPSAYFLTDVNNPDELNIPTGSWIFRMYLSQSSNSGTSNIQALLYKYDGSTFTLINTGATETITNGTTIDLYTFSLAIPSGTTLTATDRLAIVLTASNLGGKTLTLYTQDTRLAQIQTTYSTGLTALNGLTDSVQYFAVGTSGTDFAISSSANTHTFNLPTASASNRGALSSADWTTFNNKISGSGTTNYVSKFSASGTITNSLIQDNGTTLGVGATPVSTALVKLNTSTINNVFEIFNSKANGQGIYILVSGAGGIGAEFQANGTTGSPIGFKSSATGVGATKNTGGYFLASGGTNNYGLRVVDGTQGIGKFLKDFTGQGESNWASITISDISNLSSWSGSTSLTTLGTITTGVWNGTAIGDSYLASTFVKANGTVGLSANWNAGAFSITANTFTANNGFTFNVGLGGTLVSASTTGSAKTWTLPNKTGNIALTSDIPSLSSAYVGNTLQMTYGIADTSGYFSLDSSVASSVTLFRVYSADTVFYTNWLSKAVVGSYLELNQSASIYGLYNITSITYDAVNLWYVYGVSYINGSGTFTLDSQSYVSFQKQNFEVKEEGSSLSTKVKSINFTGGGATASIIGDDVTVDIPLSTLNLGLVYPMTTFNYLT